MKTKSYSAYLKALAQKGPYTGNLVGVALKHRHIVDGQFTRDIQLCLLESETFVAAERGDDLAARFQESRAVNAWVHWVDKFSRGQPVTPPAEAVRVDWAAGVFQHDFDKPGCSPTYGCVADIRHCLYDRESVAGERLSAPSLSDGNAVL